MKKQSLTIIPSVPVWKRDDTLRFDRKFYDGLVLYTRFWPGPVTCVMSLSNSALPDFGVIDAKPGDMPFTCVVLKEKEIVSEEHVRGASIVLASADAHDQLHIAALCRKIGVKCVYVIEYIPETRYQIAALNNRDPFVRLRQNIYLWRMERKRLQAFELCDGLQSNGTPAFFEYRQVPDHLLYFDTRVTKEQFIGDEELEKRLTALRSNNALRLAFSGRLVHMKGADHLVQLALKLKRAGMLFHLSIYGTGDLEEQMKLFIKANDLETEVTMHGAVDFHRQLLPDVKENVDVFVILHRQSDPSCTYLETLSCGVPIVGYRNQAFAGILNLADIGWGVNPDDLDAVSWMLMRLDISRREVAEKSRNALAFAKLHDFDTTFRNRIDHLLSITNDR